MGALRPGHIAAYYGFDEPEAPALGTGPAAERPLIL